MDKNLSILQFINVKWLNAEADYGLKLSKKLVERGHRVFISGVENSPPILKARDLGLSVFTALKLHHYNPYYLFKDLNILADFIKKEKIQIINAHRSEGHILAALYKKIFNQNLIIIRTRGDVRLPKNYFINRWLYNYTDKIITSAHIMEKMYFKDLNIPEEKITTIINAIDINKFTPEISGKEFRESINIKDSEILVGIVGRLSPIKGHKYFLEAASKVLIEFPDIKFLITGEEFEVTFTELKSYAEKLGITNSVIFLVRQKDAKSIIAGINIGVVASLGSETNCRVTQEFMSMGKPVIATSVGVIPEVILDNESGIIVPPKNSILLASAIINLIKNPSFAETLGKNARMRIIKEFNDDLFAEKTEKVYYDLL